MLSVKMYKKRANPESNLDQLNAKRQNQNLLSSGSSCLWKVRDLSPILGMTWTFMSSIAARSSAFLFFSVKSLSSLLGNGVLGGNPKGLQPQRESGFCYMTESCEDTIRRLSCNYACLQELCRTGTREEAFLLFWLWTVNPVYYLNENYNYLFGIFWNQDIVTFSLLYTKNNVWKVQTLLSTLYAYVLRKLDFHTL